MAKHLDGKLSDFTKFLAKVTQIRVAYNNMSSKDKVEKIQSELTAIMDSLTPGQLVSAKNLVNGSLRAIREEWETNNTFPFSLN